MATHYQAIGFNADTLEGLEGQVIEAATMGRHYRCGPGADLSAWEDANGAALWIQIRDGAIVGAHPFFAAGEVHPTRVEDVEPDPGDAMDGRARLFLLPDATVLLPVDIVNWSVAVGSLRPQSVVGVRLVAFAEGLSLWPSPEAYAAARPESRRQGVRWIVPTGLFPEEKGGTGRATANITGVVAGAEARINNLTGAAFRRLRLETSGATIDVVAADGPLPAAGAVARGHFWLAGEIVPSVADASAPG